MRTIEDCIKELKQRRDWKSVAEVEAVFDEILEISKNVRPKSRWLTVRSGRVLCENCTYVNDPWFKYFNFCPNCGADMRKVKE